MIRRMWVAGLLLGLLFPFASDAGELTIPALGVRIPDLPDNATPPEVTARLDGLMAVVLVGTATLTIARVGDPVPPGSDVRDPAYRSTLEAYFGGSAGSEAPAQATSVAGYDAWTTVSARRMGPDNTGVSYTTATYTIVDQHLYRIAAAANGGNTTPADYAAVVRLMSSLAIGAVDGAAVEKLGAPAGLLHMPSYQVNFDVDLYPATAKRLNEQGIAGIEFSINGKGHAQDIRELYATAADLGKGAQAVLGASTFKVLPDWAQKGYQSVRFSMEFQYSLVDKPPCPGQAPPRLQTAEVVAICASKLKNP